MIETRVIAQLAIPAAAETVLYTVQDDQKCNVQGFTFCNRSVGTDYFRLSISKLGAPTATRDYVYYNLPLTGNNTFLSELDVTIDNTDVIRVYCTNGNISVTLYGIPS